MKRKNIIAGIALSFVMLASVFPLAACGGRTASDSEIRFLAYGDQATQDMYIAVAEKYNQTQGKKDGISVDAAAKSESDYTTMLQVTLTGKTAPDVFISTDVHFKTRVEMNMAANMTEYVQNGSIDFDSMYESTYTRFRYDKESKMSKDDGDTYGLPFDTSASAMFYNKTALTARGVIVISVEAEDMEKWNNNEIADLNGKRKSDYAALNTIDVPAKGFFRDDAHTRKTQSGEAGWTEPNAGTVMVFNDRIPMNWDEVEDVGYLMTKSKNQAKPTTDEGYYTTWWYNYGWSVGGDCLEDVSGNGSWVYSHGDWQENYIVNEGKTYTGVITGKEYVAGETIEFLDKLDVKKGDKVTADNKGGYKVNGKSLGAANGKLTNDSATRPEVKEKVKDGTLSALPSVREAFTRFCNLSGKDSSALGICPNPAQFQSGDAIRYFTSGRVAFCVETSDCVPTIVRLVGENFDWAVAPLPVYKTYTEPSDEIELKYGDKADAYNTTVETRGKTAGHSESTALCINERSKKKDKAYKFIEWMVGPEGQKAKAEYGYMANHSSAQSDYYAKYDSDGTKKLKTFVDALSFETPGDWWYLANDQWILVWSVPLNSEVREAKLTLSEYFATYIGAANEAVKSYGNWDNGLDTIS